MKISSKLIKEFTRIVNTNVNDSKKDSQIVYGVVRSVDTNKKIANVLIDGSSLTTPVEMAMDAKKNDRVVITIKNHNAFITGNVTSPAGNNENVNGIRVIHTDDNSVTTKAEVITLFETTNNQVDYSKPNITLRLNEDGTQIQISPEGKIFLNASNGIYINNKKLSLDKTIIYGSINFKNKTILANKTGTFTFDVTNLPEGYTLLGISEVNIIGAGSKVCHLCGFWTHPTGPQVGARWHNTFSNDVVINGYIEYFAYLSNFEIASPDEIDPGILDYSVTLDDEESESIDDE